MQLAVSTDMLVEDRHFFYGTNPERLGHRRRRQPSTWQRAAPARWHFTLALALPAADDTWLAAFHAACLPGRRARLRTGRRRHHAVRSTCASPWGRSAPARPAAQRRAGGRRPVCERHTGRCNAGTPKPCKATAPCPGPAEAARQRLEQPTPRWSGLALRGVASAALDVSDGLLGDLAHILRASGVGACGHLDYYEFDSCKRFTRKRYSPFDLNFYTNAPLASGDDYELLFTAPAAAALRWPPPRRPAAHRSRALAASRPNPVCA